MNCYCYQIEFHDGYRLYIAAENENKARAVALDVSDKTAPPGGVKIKSVTLLPENESHTPGPKDAIANARLVGAAPDLLKACNLFVAALNSRKKGALAIDPTYEDWQTVEFSARTAIAKAMGDE